MIKDEIVVIADKYKYVDRRMVISVMHYIANSMEDLDSLDEDTVTRDSFGLYQRKDVTISGRSQNRGGKGIKEGIIEEDYIEDPSDDHQTYHVMCCQPTRGRVARRHGAEIPQAGRKGQRWPGRLQEAAGGEDHGDWFRHAEYNEVK